MDLTSFRNEVPTSRLQRYEKHCDEINALSSEIMQQKVQTNALEERVEGLLSSFAGYRNLRGRFISIVVNIARWSRADTVAK